MMTRCCLREGTQLVAAEQRFSLGAREPGASRRQLALAASEGPHPKVASQPQAEAFDDPEAAARGWGMA